MTLDLNCDLGEGERNTAALLGYVTSANIACGGHAGDLSSMRRTVRLALSRRVHVGAHPGLPDRSTFGRGAIELSPAAFELLLLYQISALEAVLRSQHASHRLHHIKLHGALYHMVEESAALRKTYLQTIAQFWPRAILFARAGGTVVRDAGRHNLQVWPEGFLDRAYLPDGTLVPRTSPNALLNPAQFKERLRSLGQRKPPVPFNVRTWCIHGDSPHALAFARFAAQGLINARYKRFAATSASSDRSPF